MNTAQYPQLLPQPLALHLAKGTGEVMSQGDIDVG
jgi:hypothetical protein